MEKIFLNIIQTNSSYKNNMIIKLKSKKEASWQTK